TDPVITSTFSDMYKDLRKWGLAIGVEGNEVVVEQWPYFFNPTKTICTIPKIREGSFKKTPATDFMGNIIKVGYPDPTGDQLNMTNEINALEEYNGPV